LDEIQPSQFFGSQSSFNNEFNSNYHTLNQNDCPYVLPSFESCSNSAINSIETQTNSSALEDPNNFPNQSMQNENLYMRYFHVNQNQLGCNQTYSVYNPIEVNHQPFQDFHLNYQYILNEQRATEQERLNKKIIAYQKRLLKLTEKEDKTCPCPDRAGPTFNNFQHKQYKKRGRKPKNEKRVVLNKNLLPYCFVSNAQVNSGELARSTSSCSLNFELENFAKNDHFNKQF
jgi:hypothetical protein